MVVFPNQLLQVAAGCAGPAWSHQRPGDWDSAPSILKRSGHGDGLQCSKPLLVDDHRGYYTTQIYPVCLGIVIIRFLGIPMKIYEPTRIQWNEKGILNTAQMSFDLFWPWQGKSSFCLQPLPPLTASESDPGPRPRSGWLMTGFCCLFLLATHRKNIWKFICSILLGQGMIWIEYWIDMICYWKK